MATFRFSFADNTSFVFARILLYAINPPIANQANNSTSIAMKPIKKDLLQSTKQTPPHTYGNGNTAYVFVGTTYTK